MDLVQTSFNCCAINSNINYDTSLWRLQAYGPRDYPVPLTCCHLTNRNDYNSFLDPRPINITTCESLQSDEYSNTRHTEVSTHCVPVYSSDYIDVYEKKNLKGCLNKIELWYRQQYVVFLGIILLLAITEFCILLTIILNCTKISIGTETKGSATTSVHRNRQHRQDRSAGISHENVYLENNRNSMNNRSLSPADDIRETYIQPPDLYNTNYSTTFKPTTSSKYQYQISQSYLV